MKILKQGNPVRKVFQGTCASCGCEAQAEWYEMHRTWYDLQERKEVGTASCPCCREPMNFYLTPVPVDQNPKGTL